MSRCRPSYRYRAPFGDTTIEYLCDIRMVQNRKRLALRLESGHNLLAVHSRFQNLQRDASLYGLGLLGKIYDRHAALNQSVQNTVRTYLRRVVVTRNVWPGRPGVSTRELFVRHQRFRLVRSTYR